MKKFIINGLKVLNWQAIVIPGVILSLELLIKSLMKRHEQKQYRYSTYNHERIT